MCARPSPELFLPYCRFLLYFVAVQTPLSRSNHMHCPKFVLVSTNLVNTMHLMAAQHMALVAPPTTQLSGASRSLAAPCRLCNTQRRLQHCERRVGRTSAVAEPAAAAAAEMPRLDAALDDRLSGRPLQLDAAGYFIIKVDREARERVADFYTNVINEKGAHAFCYHRRKATLVWRMPAGTLQRCTQGGWLPPAPRLPPPAVLHPAAPC